jgi:hypothetical protein
VQTVYSDIHDGGSHTQRAEGERYTMEGEKAQKFWEDAASREAPTERPLVTPKGHPAEMWGEDCHLEAVQEMAWELSR